jgi:aspartate/methionine/tyrosine aminotransferase
MLPPIPYLEWIQGRPAAATHDLGSSDLSPGPDGEGAVPPRLADSPVPPDGTTLEAQLAAEYGVPPSQVLVAAGATHANVLATMVARDLAGANRPRVVVERPGYQPLVETPRGLGARVDRFDRPATDGFRLRPEALDGVLDDSVAHVTVTNRHNPSGALASRETLAAVADRVADAGSYLVVDEVYAPYRARPADASGAFGGPTAAGLQNTVVTSSLTKFHGLGGLRIGWVVGPQAFVDRARSVLRHLPAVAEPSRALARRALHDEDRLGRQSRSLLERNAAQLRAFVSSRSSLRGEVPPDCTFAFLSADGASGDAVAEAAAERGVLVVPGRFFDSPDRFRLSLGRDPDAMGTGLAALEAALDDA